MAAEGGIKCEICGELTKVMLSIFLLLKSGHCPLRKDVLPRIEEHEEVTSHEPTPEASTHPETDSEGRASSYQISPEPRPLSMDARSPSTEGVSSIQDVQDGATLGHPFDSLDSTVQNIPRVSYLGSASQYLQKRLFEEPPQEERKGLHKVSEASGNSPVPPCMPAELSATVGQQSSEEVRLELVLAMDLNEIAGDEEWFKESIAQDVAKAVGGDPSKVRFISLVAGSIRVLMALDEGICGDGRGALDVANDLQQQAADPNSPLKSGGITGATIGANVMIAKVPLTAGQTTSAIERPMPISSKTDNIEIPGHATLHLEQLLVKHSAHLQHDGVVMGTLVSPTVNLAPTVQIAAPVRRSAKLSNMPIGRGLSEANKAEDDSKQEAFTEEIARLSALAEDRRCELLDTHARINSLEEELGAQKKYAQKATAGMYVEMDRMQTLIDSD